MKETSEVVKCDWCHRVIDTDTVSIEKYHYKYCITDVTDGKIETDIIEKDICPDCISKIYNQIVEYNWMLNK